MAISNCCFSLICTLQLDRSNVAYVMDRVLINIQLIINNCLSNGFPDQINESFMRMYRYDINIVLILIYQLVIKLWVFM